jgi:molecular chaperone DnaK
MSRIIGIDLGTTNSCVAVIENGTPKVLINKEGQRTTPSIVAYNEDGSTIIGDAAKRQFVINPKNTISSVKRFIGSNFKDISDKSDLSYEIAIKNDTAYVVVNEKQIAPQEISAKVLIELKKVAEEYYGESVTDAVITCPAYFNDAQRKATKEAGQIAGLNVLRIINEPTAAALAYGFENNENSKIIIIDLGGGTTDFTILEVENGNFNVLSTTGDTHLGGDNFNDVIYEEIINNIMINLKLNPLEFKTSPINNPQTLARIREASEKAKIDLSSIDKTTISLPFLSFDSKANMPINFQMNLTRARFEDLSRGLIDRVLTCCREAILKAKIKIDDIDEVIMVGGTTRIPIIRQTFKSFLNKPLNTSVNPDEIVAIGAAIQGGILNGSIDNLSVLDVTPLTLGIETLGGEMTPIIHANTTIPTVVKEIFSTSSDNQKSVEVHVLQGERIMAFDNVSLGKFMLDNIPPMKRAEPQIEVSFSIDSDGILSVSAKELSSGVEQNIKIQAGSGLSEDDIIRMRENAIKHQKMDELKREITQAKNTLEAKLYEARSEFSFVPNKHKTEWKSESLEIIHSEINTSYEYLMKINNHISKFNELYQKSEV